MIQPSSRAASFAGVPALRVGAGVEGRNAEPDRDGEDLAWRRVIFVGDAVHQVDEQMTGQDGLAGASIAEDDQPSEGEAGEVAGDAGQGAMRAAAVSAPEHQLFLGKPDIGGLGAPGIGEQPVELGGLMCSCAAGQVTCLRGQRVMVSGLGPPRHAEDSEGQRKDRHG